MVPVPRFWWEKKLLDDLSEVSLSQIFVDSWLRISSCPSAITNVDSNVRVFLTVNLPLPVPIVGADLQILQHLL